MKFSIEIDYTGEEGLDEAIINAAAANLLKELQRDGMYGGLMSRVRQIEDETIRAHVEPRIAQVVEKAIQPTDSFGSPKGEPITLVDHITKVGIDYLTVKQNEYGRHPESAVAKLIRETVERTVANELRKAMDEAKAEVVAAVKEEGAKVLADTITRMAGVR